MKSLAIAAILSASAAVAQQPAQPPDVAILATVHAKQLRFTEVPDVNVTFPAGVHNENVWKSDREHLPDRVAPYVTYRDIGIRLTITSTLPNIEQILDDALGQSSTVSTSKEALNGPTRTTARHHAARRRAASGAAADHDQHQPR